MKEYDVIVIGAGICGLAAALKLVAAGKKVLVLERDNDIGGLISCYDLKTFKIEKYYHHFFKQDTHLLKMIKDLGLNKQIYWKRGSTGYYVDGQEYDLNTPLQFLTYKYLSFSGKVKLIKSLLNLKFKNDLAYLDEIKASDWIHENCTEDVYVNFFKPLLDAKFGRFSDEISAAWLLMRVKKRSSRGFNGERLGYFENGFSILLKKLEEVIYKSGGEILTGSAVDKIFVDSGKVQALQADSRVFETDTVISTISVRQLRNLSAFPGELDQKMAVFKEQAVNCALFAVNRPLLKNYWVNIKNSKPGFNVLVEHTNFLSPAFYNNMHLLYLVSYDNTQERQDFAAKDSEGLIRGYKNALSENFGLQENDIIWSKLARSFEAGPVYNTGFRNNRLPYFSGLRNLYISGMAQSYPDRGVDDSILQGQICADLAIKATG